MENVLKVNLPCAWEDSEVYKQFVEVKRGDLGEENGFYIEDNSILVVSNFSGNHWDTDRQKITGGKSFSVPTSWILKGFLQAMTALQVCC